MLLPAKLTLYDFAYFLDGGTTVLRAIDEVGQNHAIMLVQHAFPQPNPSLDALPGRLYFDGQLIPMRSEFEARVLSLLRSADVRCCQPQNKEGEHPQHTSNTLILGEDIRQVCARSPEDNMRALLTAIITFVESDEYLRFADQVEQAADPTRYTVWIATTADNIKKAVVRLSRLHGIGLQAARESLVDEVPLANNATALEVAELVKRYSDEELALHVEPTFRWQSK